MLPAKIKQRYMKDKLVLSEANIDSKEKEAIDKATFKQVSCDKELNL
jgi:hypothetical protein